MSLAVKVVNFRKGPFNNALAFFNVLIGTQQDGEFTPALVLREFVLKHKKDKSSYFYQPPAKARMKNGQPVMENGFAKYDPYIDVYFEGKGEDAKISKASWAVRDAILEQAVAQFEAEDSDNEGRGQAKEAKSAKESKPAKSAGKSAKPAKPAADEEDDELPF